ncbi:MAG: CFI-box-CTERM domain-containing protein, partial [Planctomycetota bacterium]
VTPIIVGSSGPKAKCFIATATYGSPMSSAVLILQQFRDEYLLTNCPGQWLIKQYYYYSPSLANYISKHTWAKSISQITLLPAVLYAWFMVSASFLVKAIACFLLFIIVLYLKRIKLGYRHYIDSL